MKIIDTYSDIMSLFDSMNGDFDMALWETYMSKISDELLWRAKEESRRYDFSRQILPVIRYTMNNKEKLEILHNSFLAATKDLEKRLTEVLGVDLQVDIILYIGLCNGAGWVTKLGEKPVVLLGVEKIIELDWCDTESMFALIYHELGHVWHDAERILDEKVNTIREKSIMQLYQEGMAMYFEQLILDDFSFYHQNKEDWLEWCHKNKKVLNAEYLRRLQTDESIQDFFGDWCNYQGYSDVGYFIGCEFVKRLAGKYTLKEIANLDVSIVYKEFLEY